MCLDVAPRFAEGPHVTDGEYKKQKRRIQKLADRWFPILGLDAWNMDLRYEREGIPTKSEGWQCNAQTRAKWEYLRATISFNVLNLEDYDDEELERLFVHECCHVLLAEMREWGPDNMSAEAGEQAQKHEERVVCVLAEAFLRAHA